MKANAVESPDFDSSDKGEKTLPCTVHLRVVLLACEYKNSLFCLPCVLILCVYLCCSFTEQSKPYNEKKYLVFESCLLSFFRTCIRCKQSTVTQAGEYRKFFASEG